jgi:GAF domain-containing protein
LRVGDRIIGALDVQSTVEAAFSEDDVTVLQIMADQLAVAIENIRLVSEAQRAVREVEAVYGRYTRESWAKFAGQTTWGYLYRGLEVESVTAQPPEVRAALLQGQSVQVNAQPGQRSTLAVPIRLRREILGVLNVRFDEDTVPVEAVPLVEELANRLALSMENARLLAESQGRALRERQVSEITARVRAEVEVEALLERALRELGQLLDARQAAVQMEVGE